MNINEIKIGQRVEYRPSFSSGAPMLGYVEEIGEHKGQPVVDFTNGQGWAYAHQIDRIYSR